MTSHIGVNFSISTLLALAFLMLLLSSRVVAAGLVVSVETDSARAMILAILNPVISQDEALAIARLPGNRGLVRKEVSYGRPAADQDLADAIYAIAHGQPPNPSFQFLLERVKNKSVSLQQLLDQIDGNPHSFNDWIVERVKAFTPTGANIEIKGHLIVGGGSGGFAFGEPEFFLNLVANDEFEVAKIVMAHELYHAVQGALAPAPNQWWADQQKIKLAPAKRKELAKRCAATAELFSALYEEGTASLVGDVRLLSGSEGLLARETLRAFNAEPGLKERRTLLELSVMGLTAANPIAYDDVYELGFYLPELLYKFGYVMARAIVDERKAQGLTSLLDKPGYQFVVDYLSLENYGRDPAHPKLGPNTISWARALAAGCPSQ